MGCLKLTYREELPPLKVVSNNLKTSEKGCAGFYRYGFQGQEKDDEVKGSGNSYTTELRQLDLRLGRWLSTDPVAHPGMSPYNSFDNNPIYWVDPSGGNAGDYYKKDGTYLGSDGIDDNKMYIVGGNTDNFTAVDKMPTKDWQGNLSSVSEKDYSVNELDIEHSEFQKVSYVIGHEAPTTDANEHLWIAHTANNMANKRGKSLYSLLMSGYSSVPNKKKLGVRTSTTQANMSRAAALHVYSGGADPTGGSLFWDGTDLLAWGLNSPDGTAHNKFEEYSELTISSDIFYKYMNSQLSKYCKGCVKYSGNEHDVIAPVFLDNLNNNGFNYKTNAKNVYYQIEATGTHGRTIFWNRLKK